jgi:hypothetical protein
MPDRMGDGVLAAAGWQTVAMTAVSVRAGGAPSAGATLSRGWSPWLGGVMDMPADQSVRAVAQRIPPGTVRRARRRPTGEAPPLPHQLHRFGAAVAAGPISAIGVARAVRAVPADRLVAEESHGQRRPVGAHPGQRPGRRRRGRGAPQRALRHPWGDPGSIRPAGSAALHADRAPRAPVHGHPLRRVCRRLRHHADDRAGSTAGPAHQRGIAAPWLHHPPDTPAGPRPARMDGSTSTPCLAN